MAANICSDENYSNTVDHSPQEDKSISIGPEIELSELHIPKVEISSPSISNGEIMRAEVEDNYTLHDEDETKEHRSSDSRKDNECNENSPSCDQPTDSVIDTATSDSMESSVVQTDAVPFKSNLESCSKSSGATKSSLTESASSKATNSPIDEDDAGPFNQNGYRQHLKGGNLCYETFTNKDSPYYNINEGRKLALIINHENYNHYDHQNIPRRTGTRRDCESIENVFGALGFEIQIKNDLRVNEVRDTMFNIQKENNLSCLALFILTHGEENGLLYGYDSNYRLDRHVIQALLPQNCPSLAGKPKLIFVQACQGSETDDGAMVVAKSIAKGQRSRHTSTDGASEYNSSVYCIPNYADLLVFQASYHGHYSFRSSSGSWFIQTLCKEVETSGKYEDLNSVLTRISRQVALVRQSNVPSDPTLHHKRQIPLKQDTLIRQIYLKEIPFEQEDKNIDTTSRIVDVDKAIENGNGTGPSQKMPTSFKQSTRSSTNKKTSKEKCKIM